MPESDSAEERSESLLIEAAFADYQGHVYRFLRRRSSSHEEAEDLTQRVFLEAAIALQEQKPKPDSVLAWLYTIASRRLIDEVRRRARAHQVAHLVAVPEETEPVDYGPQTAKAIRRAIAALPADQRTVVVMKVLRGLEFAEIAAELGITVEACRMRLSRAVSSLRNKLEEEGLKPDA